MARRGRKRGSGPRTASGQLSRAQAVAPKEELDRDPIAVRMKMFGLSEEQARDRRAATALGRIVMNPPVMAHHRSFAGAYLPEMFAWDRERWTMLYDAGVDFLGLLDNYRKAIAAPNAARSSTGSGGDMASDDYAAWCSRSVAAWDAAVGAVLRENAKPQHRGRALYAALDYIVIRDQDVIHMREDLFVGLSALARHFGVAMRLDTYGRLRASSAGISRSALCA